MARISLYRDGKTHTVRGVQCEMGLFQTNRLQNMLEQGWRVTPEPAEDCEIIHTPCGETVEECNCDDAEVSVGNCGSTGLPKNNLHAGYGIGSGPNATEWKRFDEEATIDEIIEAIDCLDEDNTEHWTNGGKPMVVAIETLLGKSIIASQRDEAMEKMKVN